MTVSTSGDGSDPDGYLVLVNGTVQRPVPAEGSVDFEALPAGELDVSLEGLSANCSAQTEDAQQVTIAAGDTARVAFGVVCLAASGTIRVTVSSTGTDLDPSGYSVTVDDTSSAPVEPTGVTLLPASAGPHTVGLGGLNANCAVAEPPTRSIVVPLRGLGDLAFTVVCQDAPAAGRGHEIVYGSQDEATGLMALYSVNDDGSHPARLFAELQASLEAPAWAPDGSRLAFFSFPSTGPSLINIVDIEGTGRIELPAENLSFAPSLAWSPDGMHLAVPEPGDFAIQLLRVDGSGTDAYDVGCCLQDLLSLTWSPDGRHIAFVWFEPPSFAPGPFSVPVIVDLAVPGEHESPPGCNRIDTTDVAWSPDGSRLAMAAAGHIFILDLETGACTQITNGPWTDASPSWSPDGTHLAFSTTRDGNAEIYVIAADGSAPTRITRSPIDEVTPRWRP